MMSSRLTRRACTNGMQLGDAVESRSLPLTQARYSDTADALREVVAVLALSLDLEFGPDDPDE
jgi:photosystem II oxygen-evolving enhancer protein 3